jgi:hypothetical protein
VSDIAAVARERVLERGERLTQAQILEGRWLRIKTVRSAGTHDHAEGRVRGLTRTKTRVARHTAASSE